MTLSKRLYNENDDNADDYESEPRPFERLPIYGEHKRAVSAVALSPGRGTAHYKSPLCASASADGTVKIWDIDEEGDQVEIQQPLVGTSNGVGGGGEASYSLSDEGGGPGTTPVPSISTFEGTGTLRNKYLKNCRQLNPVVSLLGHSRGINDVAWSRGGSLGAFVATASDDKTLRLWDVNTGDALVEFRGHSNFVFCAKFNPQSSNLLVSGSFDETVKLWDVRTGDCVSTLPAHSDPVTAVDFNRDGTCIVSGSHDGLVRIWDTATGECLKTIYAHGNPPVSHVQYSPNGKYVLAGTLDSRLRLWPVAMATALSKHTTTTTNATRSSSNSISGVTSGSSSKISSTTGNSTSTHKTCVEDNDNNMTRGGKCTKMYESSSLHHGRAAGSHINTRYCIVSDFLVSHPRRQCIVTGSETGKLVLYDINSRRVRQVLEGHSDAVLAVAAHDTEELMVSGGMTEDKTVQFWRPKGHYQHRHNGRTNDNIQNSVAVGDNDNQDSGFGDQKGESWNKRFRNA